MQKGTIGAAKIGASMALLLAAVVFSIYYMIPALSIVTPGSTQFGQGLQLNMTAMTDMFVTTGNTVYLVANFTCTESTNCTNITGRSSYANFTEIGGGSSVIGVEIPGTNETNIGFSYNATVNTPITNIQSANITANFTASDGNVSNVWTAALLVNMSTITGCPPAGQQLPPQIPLLNGSMVPVAYCWTNCTGNERAVLYNSTHYQICGPTFGGDTTNFTAIAESGNFSNVPLVIDLPGKAKINFTSGINFSSQQYVQAVMEFAMKNLMTGGRVGINDTEWSGQGGKPNLNITARLTLYNVSAGLGITGQPQIIRTTYGANLSSGSTCPANICTNLVWDGQNLTFTVSGFSDYGLSDAINITLNTPANYTYAGNNSVFNNRTVNFTFTPVWDNTVSMKNCTVFGNFTNADWAINNSNVTPLVNNTVNGIPVAINADGPYRWNVYCYDTLNTYDYYYNNWSVIFDSVKPILRYPTPANASYIYGLVNEVFQINVTETNLNSSANITLYYMKHGATDWNPKTLGCYDKAGSAGLAAGSPYKCNTTVDVKTLYVEGNQIDYFFNITDLAGNTGVNGTQSDYLHAIVDKSAPTYNVSGSNSTTIGINDGILLYALWNDNYALYNAILSTNETYLDGTFRNITNAHSSPLSLSGTSSWSNFSWSNSSVPAGTVIAWKIYVTDQVQPTRNENVTAEGTFTIDGTAPTPSGNATSLANGTTYNNVNNYGFQINWNDVVGVSNATFELGRPDGTLINYTNATTPGVVVMGSTYYINFTQAAFGPAGTYNFSWLANDTSNNWNRNDTINYVINKAAAPTVQLLLNGTQANKNYNKSDVVNQSAVSSISGLTVTLYNNFSGTLAQIGSKATSVNVTNATSSLTLGTYLVLANVSSGENYTANITGVNYTITLLDGIAPTLIVRNATSQEYLNATRVKNNTVLTLNISVSDNDRFTNPFNVSVYIGSTFAGNITNTSVNTANGTVTVPAGLTNGNLILNVSVADASGNVLYNTTYAVDVDNIAPVIIVNIPQTNNSYIQGTATELFSTTVTEANLDVSKNITLMYSLQGTGVWTNKRLDCFGSSPYTCNGTIPLNGWSDGDKILYYFNTTDLAGNVGRNGTDTTYYIQTIDRTKPQYLANVSTPDTYANYSGGNYGFQINWTNGAAGIQTVSFQLGRPAGTLINSTASLASGFANTYIVNFTQASFGPSGIYNITWFANDTAGNANTAGTYNYQIYNTTNILNMYLINSTAEYLNQDITITYGTPITLNAAATMGTVTLYRNASASDTGTAPNENATETVTLGAGVWVINASVVSNNANYSDNTTNITYYVTVNKASPASFLNLQINGTGADSVRVYPNVTNVTGWSNLTGQAGLTFTLFRNNVNVTLNSTAADYNRTETNLLGVGNYTYIYNTTGNANYTSGSISRSLNITKGTPALGLFINSTASNQAYGYPTVARITGNNSDVGNSDMVYELFRNNTNITSTVASNDANLTLGAAVHQLIYNATAGTNYTSASATLYLTISKAATSMQVWLNGTAATSATYNRTQVLNFTAALNISGKTIYLDSNYSAGWINQSVTPLENLTTLNTKGIYNFTAYFNADENYTASANYTTITVNDVGIPAYTGNATSLASGSSYSTSANYGFQIDWTDDTGVFNATFQLGRPNGQITNYTNSSGSTPAVRLTGSTYHINFTQAAFGPAGTYNITWFANDTSSNWNRTDTVIYVINQAPLSIIAGPQTQIITYGTSVTQYCSTNITGLSCSIYRNSSLISNDTSIVLAAKVYNYTANITDTANYTIYQNSTLLTINQAVLSLTIASNGTQTYPYTSTAEAAEGNSGDSDITYWLTRNGTLVDSSSPYVETIGLAAGAYNYTFNTSSTTYENYTANATGVSTILTINKAATNVTLWINNNAANASIEQGNNINLTATVNITGAVYIYANLTGWALLSNSTGTLTNTTSSSGVSPLNYSNITAYFADDGNYTASSQHFHINVTADTTAPTIQLFNATSQPFLNASVVKKYNSIFAVNASVSDTGVGVSGQTCTAYVNGTSAGSGTESGGFCNITVTMPAGGNGNVTLNITINDTNGNLGSNASFVVTMDNTAPNLTIDAPASGQYVKNANDRIFVNGTVYDNIAMGTANISINNSAFIVLLFNGTNNTAFNVSNSSYVADGYIALNLGYVDLGGSSGNATIAFYVDNTPPLSAVGLTNSSAGTYQPSATQVVQVAVTDALRTNASITLNYKLGTASWATTTMTGTAGATTVYTGMIDTTDLSAGGFVKYYISGTDNATNSITAAIGGSTSGPLNNFTVSNAPDQTAPSISFNAPTNSTNVTTTTPTITFVVTDNSNIQLNTITVTGVSGFSAAKNCTGNQLEYSCSFKPTALTNGANYTITATAKDGANISATSSITVGVDTTKSITASLIASDTTGVADNTYANGWSYTFNITLGTGVNATRVKLNNFTMTGATNTIGVPGNVIMNYTNASGYAKSYSVLESYNESATIERLFDLDTSAAGVQGNVTIYVKIPSGTVAGAYSTAYTFGSYAV